MTPDPTTPSGARRLLPRIGSPAYHLLLASVAILILGPLGGISAAFMNFSIGFFIGGQVLAKVFMHSYTVLRVDQFSHPHAEGAQQWQSAMTYKIVGALKGITNPQPYIMKALRFGILLGLMIDIARKLIKRNRRYQQAVKTSRGGRATDFVLDAVLVPSPYASSFGGFVELPTVLWWTAGGVGASVYDLVQARLAARRPQAAEGQLPSNMSTTSLVGGGLIAGDSLAALSVGLYGLLKTVL